MKIVAITGANGFVGRQLCQQLSRHGWSVRAIVRAGSDCSGLSGDNLRLVEVPELQDGVELRTALADAGAVVHLAGLAHAFPAPTADEFDRVNHRMTVEVANAAILARVRRFILLSTIKVNGESTAGRPFEVEQLPAPQDDYGRSKYLAERALLELSRQHAIESVVIRPPLVYGPGARANFARLVRLVDRGWPLPFSAVRNRRTMVSLDNLNHLITLALEHPAAAGGTFLAGDDRAVSTPELVRLIGHALGRRPRLFAVPEAWLRRGARLAGQQALASRLLDSLEVSTAAARRELGWVPPFSVEEGIARAVASSRASPP